MLKLARAQVRCIPSLYGHLTTLLALICRLLIHRNEVINVVESVVFKDIVVEILLLNERNESRLL